MVKKCHLNTLLALGISLLLLGMEGTAMSAFGQSHADDAVTALERGVTSRADLNVAIKELRGALAAGEALPNERLLAVVCDPVQHLHVRSAVLKLLLDQRDPAILVEVVSRAARWQFSATANRSNVSSEARTEETLLYALLRRLPDHPGLSAVAQTPAFEELLGNALASSPLLDEPGPPLLTLLARAPMREEAKERLATETILRAHAANFLGKEFVFAVRKSENIQAIRDALAGSPNIVEFHYGAASALAMLGDPIAAAELHRRAKVLAPRREEPGFGNFVRQIEYYADFADAAASPESIMRYLAKDVDPRDSTGICAALRVASRFGLTKEDVRPALLTLPERARAATAKLTEKPRIQRSLALMSLVPVRTTAVELGFLDSTDLPDVEAYAREQAKHAATP